MFRQSKRRDVDGLRAQFLANREKVKSWVQEWDCAEAEWPTLADVPDGWAVLAGETENWLTDHAPFLTDYGWVVRGTPIARQLNLVTGSWKFGHGHEFVSLAIEFRCTVLDPGYLAEMLALGAHAADLEGWREEDLQPLYEWLLEAADLRPVNDGVRGQKRSGFLLFEFQRMPLMSGLSAQLTVTTTRTALDGSPLNAEGGST